VRAAILSDIHSNFVALESVIRDIQDQRRGADRYWALGDLVGYGPWPNQTLDLLQTLDHSAVAGNHDLAAVGRESTDLFNTDAEICCRWNGDQLSASNREYLLGLPQVVTEGEFTLVHGSLRDPVWEYLVHVEAAAASFERMTTQYLAIGHSHLPMLFEETDNGPGQRVPSPIEGPIATGNRRTILNPGSVGQPRDGDPRASYAIWDSDDRTITYHRVEYDFRATRDEMDRVGLPPRMSARLEHGW
jgi:predicted phosphodiesterase